MVTVEEKEDIAPFADFAVEEQKTSPVLVDPVDMARVSISFVD